MTTMVQNEMSALPPRRLSLCRSRANSDYVLGEAIIDLNAFLTGDNAETEQAAQADCFEDYSPFEDSFSSGNSSPAFDNSESPFAPSSPVDFGSEVASEFGLERSEDPFLAAQIAANPFHMNGGFEDSMPAVFTHEEADAVMPLGGVAAAPTAFGFPASVVAPTMHGDAKAPTDVLGFGHGLGSAADRAKKLKKDNQKKLQRRWGKRIKYQDRKVQAENQHRVRGRFAKLPPEVAEQRRIAKEAAKAAKEAAKQAAKLLKAQQQANSGR